MQYRQFGHINWQPSALGFGCMRLPTAAGADGTRRIDRAEATRMLRYAIDQGVNYLDSAYPYHSGESEVFLGEALQDGYRDKVKLATKLPMWSVQKAEDFDAFLQEQLHRLRTDHLDLYLFHGINAATWHEKILAFGLLRKMEEARDQGRIRHIGFSFHGTCDELQEIIEGYKNWDFCQIQHNYMDINNQAGTKGLQFAARHGLGVIVMEPLLGGKLALPPSDVRTVMEAADKTRTPADWALQWLWDQPDVGVVLSGMNTMEQVEQNLASADQSRVGSFSAAEKAVIAQVRQQFEQRKAIPCTSCAYCMPCPNGVNIPENFKLYNDGIIYDRLDDARRSYAHRLADEAKASRCIQCRVCEEKCPQQIEISAWMPKVDAGLGK